MSDESKAGGTSQGSKRSCAIEVSVADFGSHYYRMSINKKDSRELQATQWAARLMESVRAVMAQRPEADMDNVRHTLILLEVPPLERLRKSLTRGRALAQRK